MLELIFLIERFIIIMIIKMITVIAIIDNIMRIVRLEVFQKFGLVGEVKWYNHKPENVVDNDKVKMWYLTSKQIISYNIEGLI